MYHIVIQLIIQVLQFSFVNLFIKSFDFKCYSVFYSVKNTCFEVGVVGVTDYDLKPP